MLNVQLYVGAVTLNNVGVRLMEMGSRENAVKTILDAVRAFRAALHENSDSARFAVEDKVKRALGRLEEQRGSGGAAAADGAPPRGRAGLRPERIEIDGPGVGAFRVATRTVHNLHAAVVLRNAAIAFDLLGTSLPEGHPSQVSLVQNACKVLQLADSVVCTGFAVLPDDDPSGELRLCAAASSLAATMICVYPGAGRAAEVPALEAKRRRLEQVLRQYQAAPACAVASE
jgi:hypothetical protein